MSTVLPTRRPLSPHARELHTPLISVVIPCLNEAENIEACVAAALRSLRALGVPSEVVVVDNNSEDDSARLAEGAGARVVVERRRGYGSAYLAGFEASRCRYIVMADADLTYHFNELPRRLAPPALSARAQPKPPVHCARRAARGVRCADRRRRWLGAGLLRALLGAACADRRGAADDRRYPGACPWAVRARLRHLLHGRARSLV